MLHLQRHWRIKWEADVQQHLWDKFISWLHKQHNGIEKFIIDLLIYLLLSSLLEIFVATVLPVACHLQSVSVTFSRVCDWYETLHDDDDGPLAESDITQNWSYSIYYILYGILQFLVCLMTVLLLLRLDWFRSTLTLNATRRPWLLVSA